MYVIRPFHTYEQVATVSVSNQSTKAIKISRATYCFFSSDVLHKGTKVSTFPKISSNFENRLHKSL